MQVSRAQWFNEDGTPRISITGRCMHGSRSSASSPHTSFRPVLAMPSLSWPSSLSKSKMRFNKILDLFKRRVSVTEMTEAPHSSLVDFLAQRNSDQVADVASILSMCPTCHEKMPARKNDGGTAIEEPVAPDSGSPQSSISFIFSPAQSPTSTTPTTHTRQSSERAYDNIAQVTEDKRLSQDTQMASPSALVQALRQCIPTHPVLVNLPPPFNRHSDPTCKEGPAKRAEIVRQASQMALQHRCSDLDDETDRLAKTLGETERELSESTQQLESVIEELVAREGVNQELRETNRHLESTTEELRETAHLLESTIEELVARDEASRDILNKWSELEEALKYRVRQPNATTLELRSLYRELAKRKEQAEVDDRRIQTLQKCRRHGPCELRKYILFLNDQLDAATNKLKGLEGVKYRHDLLEYENQALRGSNERLMTQNRRLEAAVQDLQNQRSAEEDVEATQMAEREVYVVHERLKMTERELKQRRTSLTVVRQSNNDLMVEIACLKHRLADKQVVG